MIKKIMNISGGENQSERIIKLFIVRIGKRGFFLDPILDSGIIETYSSSSKRLKRN